MNKYVRNTTIFTTLFALAFGGAFLSQYKKPTTRTNEPGKIVSYQPTTSRPLTDKQKLLNSLLDIKQFEVDANVDMFTEDNNHVTLNLNGVGDISDFDNIQIDGDINVGLNGSNLKANFGYFDGEIFFDFNESYFRLETDSLLDFIKLLPTEYETQINVPTEIEELDLEGVENFVNGMSEKELTPNGQNYFFVLDLSEKISLKILTDLDLNFTGVSIDSLSYDGMIFSAQVALNRVDSVQMVNPKLDVELYNKYQDFKPVFTLFDAFYTLSKEKQNTINVDLSVYKNAASEKKALVNTNLDITYDLLSESHTYALGGKITSDFDNDQKMKSVDYSFALANQTIYAHYGDIAISVENDSVNALIDYVLSKIGSDDINTMIDSMSETLNNDKIIELTEKASQLLGKITLTNEQLGIGLNTSIFSTNKVNLSDLVVEINFSDSTKKLTSLEIKGVKVNEYEGDVILSFNGYKPFNLDAVAYQPIDSLIPMAGFYDIYKDQTKFRLEFDATVGQENKEDITVDGGFQFEVDPERFQQNHNDFGYGYGLVSITDRKDVVHNLYADMKNIDEILLSYSTVIGDTKRDSQTDPMYAKMKVKTILDIGEIAWDIVKDPDEHFYEIINSIIGNVYDMPIYDAIENQNYQVLLTTNYVDRFEVGNGYFEMDIALDVLAFENTSFTLRVEYDLNSWETACLKALKVFNFEFKGMTFEFNAYLKSFDESLASGRLSPEHDYMDFSDLKVLLQLGLNTSESNYYHFTTSKCKIKFSFFSLPFEISIDGKVWTNHGDVEVSADIDIPIITLLNGENSASDRVGHIYYHDGYIYVRRTDKTKEGGFIGIGATKYSNDYRAKYETNDFLADFVKILCVDLMVIRDTWYDMISSSITKTSTQDYTMKYEKILKDFVYSEDGHYFYFDVDIAEIANNTQLKKLTAKILTDDTNTQLKGINPYMEIGLLGSLGITFDLEIVLNDTALVADDSNRLYACEEMEALLADKPSKYEETIKTKI